MSKRSDWENYLQAEDVPEKMAITNDLWRLLQIGNYKACISEMVMQELSDCYEIKRLQLIDKLSEIDFEFFEINEDINELAQKYVSVGAFSDKHFEDALHVACASVNACSVVVSWNFKHIVKLTAIRLVNGVNRQEGYIELDILSPEGIVEE